jgi:hypothetical protein
MLPTYNSNALKLLRLICFIIYHFSSLGNLKVLYIATIQQKFEYMSVTWNNLTLADSNKLENIQRSLQSCAITSQILQAIMNEFLII